MRRLIWWARTGVIYVLKCKSGITAISQWEDIVGFSVLFYFMCASKRKRRLSNVALEMIASNTSCCWHLQATSWKCCAGPYLAFKFRGTVESKPPVKSVVGPWATVESIWSLEGLHICCLALGATGAVAETPPSDSSPCSPYSYSHSWGKIAIWAQNCWTNPFFPPLSFPFRETIFCEETK